MNDLTKGSPLKLIFFFTIPLLIGNLFQQLYNVSDTVVVGQTLGVKALAAVGATGSINFLVLRKDSPPASPSSRLPGTVPGICAACGGRLLRALSSRF